ncbi:flagellar biosynthesis regulator FlaF [Cypionkella sp.]|uniref:flagellar biosynthesis regulator FlaF n=1 Tax=Cypionkella sp. TaxID=2811411 RepID=UPI002FDCC470
MTAHFTAARSVYARPEAPQKTPRSIEYDLLARVTQRLAAAWATRTERFHLLAAALDENQRIWSTLASDVASSENGLPAKLRAQLFYLYEFTALHSRAVRDNKASVEVLIEINTAVMRGLRGEGGTQ